MGTYFYLFAVILFLSAAGVFVWRSRSQAAPRLMPYAVAVGGGLIAAFTGANGAIFPAIGIFAAASFLLVHLASEPFAETAGGPAE